MSDPRRSCARASIRPHREHQRSGHRPDARECQRQALPSRAQVIPASSDTTVTPSSPAATTRRPAANVAASSLVEEGLTEVKVAPPSFVRISDCPDGVVATHVNASTNGCPRSNPVHPLFPSRSAVLRAQHAVAPDREPDRGCDEMDLIDAPHLISDQCPRHGCIRRPVETAVGTSGDAIARAGERDALTTTSHLRPASLAPRCAAPRSVHRPRCAGSTRPRAAGSRSRWPGSPGHDRFTAARVARGPRQPLERPAAVVGAAHDAASGNDHRVLVHDADAVERLGSRRWPRRSTSPPSLRSVSTVPKSPAA